MLLYGMGKGNNKSKDKNIGYMRFAIIEKLKINRDRKSR